MTDSLPRIELPGSPVARHTVRLGPGLGLGQVSNSSTAIIHEASCFKRAP